MTDRRKIIAVEFTLGWQSPIGIHFDRYFMENVDLWRDIFPGKMGAALSRMSFGESYTESFAPGTLVPGYSTNHVKTLKKTLLDTRQLGLATELQPGRYYPLGAAWKALNTYPANLAPMRLLDMVGDNLVIDMNHPLAAFPLEISVSMQKETDIGAQRGGSLQHIAEILTANGLGMLLPLGKADFYETISYPLKRENDEDDKVFYHSPRMVPHLDSTAQSIVSSFYGRLVKKDAIVLDLMSSWQSHLSTSHSACTVLGLGLNEEELERNDSLDSYSIQDLNKNTRLPYDDQSIDAAICTVSMEYLCRPREIMAEICRILRPGGLFAITISERWFPGKQIHPWAELHPFERQGFILNYFLGEPRFENIHTESVRGYPRPPEDKYSSQTPYSDSLYMVWAQRTLQ